MLAIDVVMVYIVISKHKELEMYYKTIDLYKEYGRERGDLSGGYLEIYCRRHYHEIKDKVRPCMLVCPGGGYEFLSEREGEPVALSFLNAGFSAAVLTYSIHAAYPAPLAEAKMALAYLRKNAETLGILPDKIGVIGFSAGGHLAGMLSTMYNDSAILKELSLTAADTRPDASVLSYPVITARQKSSHNGSINVISDGGRIEREFSLEKLVTKDTPPAFLWHTYPDDCVPVENSLVYANACKTSGVPFEMHIFSDGWHGLSLCNAEVNDERPEDLALARVGTWFSLAVNWLQSMNFRAVKK